MTRMILSHSSCTRLYFFIFLLLAAAGCAGPGHISQLDGREIIPRLEATRQAHNIPAIAAVVVRADTILQGAAVGVRSLKNSEEPGPGDAYYLGSLTKGITALTIASLVEEGLLRWESRPEDVFPEWKDDIHPAAREINLDQLLRHSSGLTGYLEEDSPEVMELPSMPDDPLAGRQVFARYALQHAPLFTPGSRRQYSNAGYAIAAAMAEKVSGVAWETLVKDRILSPLEINSATFGGPPAAEAAWAMGHVLKEDSLVPLPFPDMKRAAWLHPAEDVWLSLTDYARLLQTQLQGLRAKNELLEAATIQYLHTPMGIEPEGLGWDIVKNEHRESSTYHSLTKGFYNTVLLQAEGNIAVVVFSNSMQEADVAAIENLLNQLVDLYAISPENKPE